MRDQEKADICVKINNSFHAGSCRILKQYLPHYKCICTNLTYLNYKTKWHLKMCCSSMQGIVRGHQQSTCWLCPRQALQLLLAVAEMKLDGEGCSLALSNCDQASSAM
jgi:hypothetical protein